MPRILVIVPTYNEKDNIARIITAIFAHAPAAHILVVDDSSPDGTGKVVKGLIARYPRKLHLMTRLKKEELGKAYVAGFRWALQRLYQQVVSMDADFSHHPKYLPKMLKAIDKHAADIVIGSRYVRGGGIKGWGWKRLVNSRGANFVTRLLLGLKPRDVTAGYKVYSARLLKKLALNKMVSSGYAFQVEMIFFGKERGAKVVEVPITFVDRRVGESKIAGELTRSAKIVFRLFLHRRTVIQAIKFMSIGLLNTFVDGGILFGLVTFAGVDKIVARIISSSIALISSYVLNRVWTFKSRSRNIARQFTSFALVNGLGLVWNNLLYGVMVKKMHIHYLLAMVIATAIVFVWNFTLTKIWAFRGK